MLTVIYRWLASAKVSLVISTEVFATSLFKIKTWLVRCGSSGSISRNQICCFSKQERSRLYCDDGDESMAFLTLSDKRMDLKGTWTSCLSHQYLAVSPAPLYLLSPFYKYTIYTNLSSHIFQKGFNKDRPELAVSSCGWYMLRTV